MLNNGLHLPLMVVGLTLILSGCKEKNYGPGCDQEVALTPTWKALELPIGSDQTRVCVSDSSLLELRSFAWDSESEAQRAIGSALREAGYEVAEDADCDGNMPGTDCYYIKDGERIAVRPGVRGGDIEKIPVTVELVR